MYSALIAVLTGTNLQPYEKVALSAGFISRGLLVLAHPVEVCENRDLLF